MTSCVFLLCKVTPTNETTYDDPHCVSDAGSSWAFGIESAMLLLHRVLLGGSFTGLCAHEHAVRKLHSCSATEGGIIFKGSLKPLRCPSLDSKVRQQQSHRHLLTVPVAQCEQLIARKCNRFNRHSSKPPVQVSRRSMTARGLTVPPLPLERMAGR